MPADRQDRGGPLAWLRRHRLARLGLSGLTGLLALAAIGLLGYPLWTNLYHRHGEGGLAHQLATPALRRAYVHHRVPTGASLTRIKIPAIGLNTVVVQGTTEAALRAGAGHYPSTPLPCTPGNVAIAGHRTTYGHPFANINRLRPGDRIEFDTPIGSCTYQVSRPPFSVRPTDLAVAANTPGRQTLTLTSCTPKGWATHRIVVKATGTAGKVAA
ncbi:MAG TPA: class E sortase [Acidimicrobiales bacterium]|nr:class E sortase [Acidimicrobiales bacterium]